MIGSQSLPEAVRKRFVPMTPGWLRCLGLSAALALLIGSLLDGPRSETVQVRYEYAYDDLFLVLEVKAYLEGGKLLAELKRTDVEWGFSSTGMMKVAKSMNFEEIHYSPAGSGRVVYRAKSRFKSPSGFKVAEDRLEGIKAFSPFDQIKIGGGPSPY